MGLNPPYRVDVSPANVSRPYTVYHIMDAAGAINAECLDGERAHNLVSAINREPLTLQLARALYRSRGQWVHGVNAPACKAALHGFGCDEEGRAIHPDVSLALDSDGPATIPNRQAAADRLANEVARFLCIPDGANLSDPPPLFGCEPLLAALAAYRAAGEVKWLAPTELSQSEAVEEITGLLNRIRENDRDEVLYGIQSNAPYCLYCGRVSDRPCQCMNDE